MIIYLHGFRSSPQSYKARSLKQHMESLGLGSLFWCEALPYSPLDAIALIETQIAASSTPVTLVGSSLGGYYATYLAEKHSIKAALINPAVVAHLSLADYVGPQTNLYTNEVFDFSEAHIDALRTMEVTTLSTPQHFLLLVETGDEVLDYRQAVEKYKGCEQVVLEGGDHSFTQFDAYRDQIIAFAETGPIHLPTTG